jgi:hypothetical protein
MSTFWRNWVNLWCLGAGLFGLVLYGAGWAATTLPTALFLDLIGKPWPADPGTHLRFAFGLMGAITIGWVITLYTLFRAAWSLEEAAAKPLYRGAALAVGVWYVIDSYVSVATGFPLNAVSNTVLTCAMLLPLIATGKLSAAT